MGIRGEVRCTSLIRFVVLEVSLQNSADMIVGKAPVLQKSGLFRPFLAVFGEFRAELSGPGGPGQRQEVRRFLALDGIVDGGPGQP